MLDTGSFFEMSLLCTSVRHLVNFSGLLFWHWVIFSNLTIFYQCQTLGEFLPFFRHLAIFSDFTIVVQCQTLGDWSSLDTWTFFQISFYQGQTLGDFLLFFRHLAIFLDFTIFYQCQTLGNFFLFPDTWHFFLVLFRLGFFNRLTQCLTLGNSNTLSLEIGTEGKPSLDTCLFASGFLIFLIWVIFKIFPAFFFWCLFLESLKTTCKIKLKLKKQTSVKIGHLEKKGWKNLKKLPSVWIKEIRKTRRKKTRRR